MTKIDNVGFAPHKSGYVFCVNSTLENLAEGNHTLSVYSINALGGEMSVSIGFTVDTHYQPPVPNYPKILLLSPQNQIYTTTELPLTFTTTEQIVNYSYILSNLNSSKSNKANVSFVGNTTLTGLSNGTYELYVFVLTQRGYAGQATYFEIDKPTETQTV